MKFIAIAAALAVLTFAAPAEAGGRDPFDDALALLEQDVPAAKAAFEVLVAEGHVEAMNMLAALLANSGDDADRSRAKELWERSVAGGSDAGRINFASHMLVNADESDDARAVAMLGEVTQPNLLPSTAYPLGRAYLFGAGVEQDLARGSQLMAEAVEAMPGNVDAQFLLGRAYSAGWGQPANPVAAYTHMKIAADAGYPAAQWHVGMMLLEGRGTTANAVQARQYVRQSAEQGYLDGMISMAVMLATGEGGDVDAVKARDWYMVAVSEGSAHALRALGGMIFTGEGGPANPIMGLALIELAAEAGDQHAVRLKQALAGRVPASERGRVDEAKRAWIAEFGPVR